MSKTVKTQIKASRKIHTKRFRTDERTRLLQSIRERRPLHKRMLMHPMSMFTILCIGVLLYGLTANALADTIISSTVEAPPLTAPATISSPNDAAVFTNPSVEVAGTCPDNSYVSLQINGAFSGVAWCDASHTYHIPVTLYPASNKLTVQDYNVTDLPGPPTDAITLTYQPPAPAPDTSVPSPSVTTSPLSAPQQTAETKPNTTSQTASPILLTSNFNFTTFNVKQSFTWKLDLEGGTPPYTVHVDWGDGTTTNYIFKTDPVFTLVHKYTKTGYFPIYISSTDINRQVRVMQLAAFIKEANGNAPFITPTKSNPTAAESLIQANSVHDSVKRLLPFAWPSYAILVLMTASFWLGEAREYRHLAKTVHR